MCKSKTGEKNTTSLDLMVL